MYWLVAGLAGVLLGIGILLMKRVFFSLSESTLSLLDAMLESEQNDSVKQKMLIGNLGKVLTSLFLFIFQIAATLVVSTLPLLAYCNFDLEVFNTTYWGGWGFWLGLTGVSILPFVAISFKKKQQDYSDMSKLLHRLLLNNYNVSRLLFKREKKAVLKKTNSNQNFVIVTGLARCGTTGLTTQLFESGKFHSLSYANLPFLLSPNLWKRFYKPNGSSKKERAHGDKVMFGLDTVEALEEFFYKAFLKDSFIGEKTLKEHKVSKEVYDDYRIYQQMVKKANENDSDYYLAKNNNFLLRYPSLREHDNHFIMLLMFRDPLDHAWSLLKQHKRFLSQQSEDGFVLEYMNWLGHHEFGLNHKVFQFGEEVLGISSDQNKIDYWLQVWLNYYSKALELPDHDNSYFIDYADFLNNPGELLNSIQISTGVDMSNIELAPFKNNNHYKGDVDQQLLAMCNEVYSRLKDKRLLA